MIDDFHNLSRKQVSILLGCSYTQTYNLEESGRLPPPLRVAQHHPRWSMNQILLTDKRLLRDA